MTTTNNRTDRILSLLKKGFCSNAAQLKDLETSLTLTLHHARNLGMEYGSLDDLSRDWKMGWDRVEESLHQIILRVEQMEGCFESNDTELLTTALAAWKVIEAEDDKMVAAFQDLRTPRVNMDAKARKDWIAVAHQLESHVETIYACARALRIKLEWSKEHSRDEINSLVQGLQSRQPIILKGSEVHAETYALQYEAAIAELDKEEHEFFGLPHNLKTLFMWVETPGERLREEAALLE